MWPFFGETGQADGSQRRFWEEKEAARQISQAISIFLASAL